MARCSFIAAGSVDRTEIMVGVILAISLVVAICALANPFAGTIGLLAVVFIRPGELYPYITPFNIVRILSIFVMFCFVLCRNKLPCKLFRCTLLFYFVSLFFIVI